MKRFFSFIITIAFSLTVTNAVESVPGIQIAAQHSIVRNSPAVDFFEGALLGNGAMGVVVRTRPDAIVIHFGHNNVWDIRISENHKDKIGTFSEIFEKAALIPDSLPSIHHDKFFSNYLNITADNYRSPYPRPFPCGSIILGFDRRNVELIGHSLDISSGRCSVNLLRNGQPISLLIDVDMNDDNLWLSLVDNNGSPIPSCFNRIRILPDPSTPANFPSYETLQSDSYSLGFLQQLPANEDCSPSSRDKAFALRLCSSSKLISGIRHSIYGQEIPLTPLERYIETDSIPFFMKASLSEGFIPDVRLDIDSPVDTSSSNRDKCVANNKIAWDNYWSASSVELEDKELERIWYHNMYFFNCAVRPGAICPGLFANWSYSNIGTAWHGDYHLNYNTQQPFWLTFSSNHLDKNLAYVDLVDRLMPVSTAWARDYYGMRGAFFPHSAYPVEMSIHPYPVPDWGWEVFETPWMVQGLWWHYLYSGDTDFLRNRAFTPIKAAVEFLVDYMSRPEAKSGRFNDGLFHIFPSVPPELYGLQPGFKYNYDTQIDITLARHIFNAYLETVDILKIKKQEKKLVNDVKNILNALPPYSTAITSDNSTILTSVPGERSDIVYNVPANLAVVFPGNEYGLHSPDSIRNLVSNTIQSHRNEGGNEIVFLNLQKARMGMLDLEAFKRQVRYATLPNGTTTDAVLETGGRYDDLTDFMYMAPMGIWFENFALPAVINECLIQSYDGIINLFPNWDMSIDANFSTLRTQGAFLISASVKNGVIEPITCLSEQGNKLLLDNPWNADNVTITPSNGSPFTVKPDNGLISFDTTPGITYTISK